MLSKSDKNTYYKQLAVNYKNTARINQCKAAVHLESEYDKRFWMLVFRHFFPQYSFVYITYSKTIDRTRATGCAACLKYFYLGCLAEDFLICIDSDYRWLLQQKDVDVKHFVFQTYTYSIENHYCYYKNIEGVFDKMELVRPQFDFKRFLEEFSRVIYPLFIHHLISLSKDDNVFGTLDFNPFIKAEVSKSYSDRETIIAELSERVNQKLPELNEYYPAEEVEAMREQCEEQGLYESNTYLYLRGHNVFDRVVLPLVKKLKMQIERTDTEAYSSSEKQAYYSRDLRETEDYLTEDILFGEYDEIIKIEHDVKRYNKERKLHAIRPV